MADSGNGRIYLIDLSKEVLVSDRLLENIRNDIDRERQIEIPMEGQAWP